MVRIITARVALALACAGAVTLAGCSKSSGTTSTTSPSATPADASINESFTTTVKVGGGVFYSFSMPQYGNVAVTLTGITGPDLPDGVTLNVGVGRPSGTTCTATVITVSPGDTPQVTGVYGPGIFCVLINDTGSLLPGTVTVTASVAHS